WATGCASTTPALLSTRRCLDTCGWRIPSCSAISPTGRGPSRKSSTICIRFGSARAPSVVNMSRIYLNGYMPVKEYKRWLGGSLLCVCHGHLSAPVTSLLSGHYSCSPTLVSGEGAQRLQNQILDVAAGVLGQCAHSGG